MNDSEYEIYEYKNNTNNNISWEIENIKNYCSSPQEFWENTTTSKIFKKYLYKLIRKNKLNPTSIAYSTFKTYIFHTAILLCCNQDKYEYFLSIYIPHFKTIKLKRFIQNYVICLNLIIIQLKYLKETSFIYYNLNVIVSFIVNRNYIKFAKKLNKINHQ